MITGGRYLEIHLVYSMRQLILVSVLLVQSYPGICRCLLLNVAGTRFPSRRQIQCRCRLQNAAPCNGLPVPAPSTRRHAGRRQSRCREKPDVCPPGRAACWLPQQRPLRNRQADQPSRFFRDSPGFSGTVPVWDTLSRNPERCLRDAQMSRAGQNSIHIIN